ncbi:hypothetical protein [Pseudomonas sp. NPDC089401]|uniref:hypothetical protein n=1 Tax=Pseudomonas sp. NPDC089401 TaxID=3364462 RepID=UPI00380864BB
MSNIKYFPPAPIEFTPEQREGITKEDLVDDKLIVQIAPYFGGAEDDSIELWLGTTRAENSGDYLVPSFTVTDPAAMNEVYFTASKLREFSGTKAFFGYRVNGNELSQLVDIDIDLSARRLVK